MLQFNRMVDVIDAHTAGEPVRVIVSGLPPIPGGTMLERMRHFAENLDGVRNFLMREPRGHRDMFGAVLTPPCTADGDVGILYLHTTGQATMCGHGTIGAVTVLLETGMLPAREGENTVRIDAPAGRVTARATVRAGKVTEVSFQNVPSFLYRDDIPVDVPGVGPIRVALSFGGGFYIFAEAQALGLQVVPEHAGEIARLAMWLKDWGNRELSVSHPLQPEIDTVYGVIVTDASERTDFGWRSRETCVFADGAVDRSPCGTGTSARLALLYGRGQMRVGESIENAGILGTVFKGTIEEAQDVGGYAGVVTRIAGTAWITGFNKLLLDPTDPLGEGFLI